jgi:Mce-associated membrane protein
MTVDQMLERDTSTCEETCPPEAVRPRWRSARAVMVLATITLVLLGYSAIMHFAIGAQDRSLEQVRSGAAEEIGELTAMILSYSPDTVETDVETAKSRLLGANEVVPRAKQDTIGAHWDVIGTSLVTAEADTATVLVLLHGTVTSGATPHTEELSSSVRVRAERTGQSWSISDLEPL